MAGHHYIIQQCVCPVVAFAVHTKTRAFHLRGQVAEVTSDVI